MTNQLISIVVLITLLATQNAMGAGWFNSRNAPKRRSIPSKIPANVLRSPEKMTELFGPSILVRKPAENQRPSRFVTQPE